MMWGILDVEENSSYEKFVQSVVLRGGVAKVVIKEVYVVKVVHKNVYTMR